MKYADGPHFPQWIKEHAEMARELANSEHIAKSIEYLIVMEVGYHKEEALLEAFENSSEKLKETMLTTEQQIEQRGMQQGMQTRSLEIARDMLKKQEPKEKVADFTGLSKLKS